MSSAQLSRKAKAQKRDSRTGRWVEQEQAEQLEQTGTTVPLAMDRLKLDSPQFVESRIRRLASVVCGGEDKLSDYEKAYEELQHQKSIDARSDHWLDTADSSQLDHKTAEILLSMQPHDCLEFAEMIDKGLYGPHSDKIKVHDAHQHLFNKMIEYEEDPEEVVALMQYDKKAKQDQENRRIKQVALSAQQAGQKVQDAVSVLTTKHPQEYADYEAAYTANRDAQMTESSLTSSRRRYVYDRETREASAKALDDAAQTLVRTAKREDIIKLQDAINDLEEKNRSVHIERELSYRDTVNISKTTEYLNEWLEKQKAPSRT